MLAVMFSANGVINGAGKTFILMLFAFCAHIIIRVYFALCNSPKMGLWGIWTSMAVGNLFSMITSLLYYYSNRWKENANIASHSAAEHSI